MSNKVIIPYNFTANDDKSIEFIINRYRDVKDVFFTLFHAYHPIPDVSENNPLMDKMNRANDYLRQQLHDQQEQLEEVKKKLISAGFSSENIQCLFLALKEDVASDLIDLIQKDKYDAVVLNRNPGNIINFFTRSISKRVSQVLNTRTRVSIHLVN